MIYFCCDERRRNLVLEHPTLNGIDFLEVSDDPADPIKKRQRTLFVHFIKVLLPGALKEENVRIEGGERIQNIKVTKATIGGVGSPPSAGSPPVGNANVLTVEASVAGDFSTYTLRLVQDADHREPPDGFDPILSAVDFSFKVSCPSDFDCKPARVCPSEPRPHPDIDYLAKDYASFRQLMLDRMAALMPQWRERNPSDLGIALVEMLAYVGDYLSYQQDAVATESYLGTARRRVSVRRHSRLVDYSMHDGRNARAWVQVRVTRDGDGLTLKKGKGRNTTKLLTRVEGQPKLIRQGSREYEKALNSSPEVFELVGSFTLFEPHNEMKFYTWSARECCLPRGATRATLRDNTDPNGRLKLRAGDVLILEELLGPDTGSNADRDPAHRHAVRLTRVSPEATSTFVDEVEHRTAGTLVEDPLSGAPIVEIEWSREDALPFPLCISARSGTAFYDDVSVALGNIVLADHGRTVTDVPETEPFDLDLVETSLAPALVPNPNPALTKARPSTVGRCEKTPAVRLPPRYRPKVKQAPITQAAPYDQKNPPASATAAISLSIPDPLHMPLPVIELREAQRTWLPARDLMNSESDSLEFAVEVETDGSAYLRFGDGIAGARPVSATKFLATYRLGNGAIGNVGADAIFHIVSSDITGSVVETVRNPLPAQGGIDPETIEEVRQNAPSAFRIQQRAVTPSDYAEVVGRCQLDVQRAAATLRWTGSWRTVFLTIDRLTGAEIDPEFEKKVRRCLERYRMAGHDIEVDGPRFVPLEVGMAVCVKPNYFNVDVKAALLDVFSNRTLPDGRRGVFHPDNFTFGQTVYLSSLVAHAQAADGVDSVVVTTFQRQGIPSTQARDAGKLELGRLEIARLDNDPDFRERGVFNLSVKGGR